MPFGSKTTPSGKVVDFNAVYDELIKPAILAAGLEPLRADQEISQGVIHKPMYERLILCDYAVADLTGANANVFYELGLRHGVRPATTVLISAEADKLPFDVGPLRTLPYALRVDKPADPKGVGTKLTAMLVEAQRVAGEPMHDSPIFQLLDGYKAPDISRLKTDAFRDQAIYAEKARADLAAARRAGKDAVAATAATLGRVDQLEAGVVIDLFLSYRAVSLWQAMVDLAAAMPQPLDRTAMVREQLGFALNRLGRRDEAEAVLTAVIKTHGANSETNGILGRVYKDRWEAERKADNTRAAKGWLNKAIETYLQGVEADWRDADPGVNAATLMTLANPADPRLKDLLPVVTYAVKRRLAKGQPDYWDHATLLELAVLASDEGAADAAATAALAAVREPWEPRSTANNLRLIHDARAAHGLVLPWADEILKDLEAKAG
jgi:hypothetical protein